MNDLSSNASITPTSSLPQLTRAGRRDARTRVALPVTFDFEGKRFSGQTIDIGARGMLIAVDAKAASGHLRFDLRVNGSTRVIELPGQVVRTTETSIAVSFADAPDTVRTSFVDVMLELNRDPVFAARLDLQRRFHHRHFPGSLALPHLSVVVPVLNEADGLRSFHQSLIQVLDSLTQWEVIYVDDGSTDGSLELLRELSASSGHVRVLSLSRNFGHQAALFAGLEASTGAAVVTIDADLQHPPDLIATLVAKWRDGFDVVSTVRRSTDRVGLFKRASSRAFYWIFNKLSSLSMPAGLADFRLMDRHVVDILLSLVERQLFLRGLSQWLGFKRTYVEYDARGRAYGEAKFTPIKMFKLAADGVFSFSFFPLRLAMHAGLLSLLVTLAVMVYVTIALVTHSNVRGWASLLVIGSFFAGLQMLVLGFVAEYIGRIFVEIKKRPRYLLKDASGFEDPVFAALAECVRAPNRKPSQPA